MEVKVIKPQLSAAPDSRRSKQDSRGMRILQYLTKTVSGKEPNNTNSNGETGLPNASSDSEESDEETQAQTSQSSSTRPSLLNKLSYRLVKTESSHTDEEKAHNPNGGAYTWGVGKSVFEVSKGVAADLKGSFGRLSHVKSRLIEKLSSMPTIPADSLEHARHSIESIILDATQSAYGKTKDAMSRIRLKLVEIIPSLTPYETKKTHMDLDFLGNDSLSPHYDARSFVKPGLLYEMRLGMRRGEHEERSIQAWKRLHLTGFLLKPFIFFVYRPRLWMMSNAK